MARRALLNLSLSMSSVAESAGDSGIGMNLRFSAHGLQVIESKAVGA